MVKFQNKRLAKSYFNHLGSQQKPFFFLIDFEMNDIRITINYDNREDFHFDFNGTQNHIPSPDELGYSTFDIHPISFDQYRSGFDLVAREIQNGNSFLLNLAYPSQLETDINLHHIFHATNALYKVYVENEFVCFSPETFVKIKEGKISSFPMKGTIDASIPNARDIILNDPKEKAEHYTIVDLIRNDLSQVAKKVTVENFRFVDEIKTDQKTLLQVSSKITGILPKNYHKTIGDIIFKLLPAGSISGAPKKKTVEIIQEAEGIRRGFYTGICGFFDGQNLDSGVMIRFVEKRNGTLYYRSGCGITAMSKLNHEYQEMIDKVYLPMVPKHTMA